jgi:hypothetical protein
MLAVGQNCMTESLLLSSNGILLYTSRLKLLAAWIQEADAVEDEAQSCCYVRV